MKTLRQQLEQDEGRRSNPYQDSKGLWTVGIGRMIDKTHGGGLRTEEIARLLQNKSRQMYDSKHYPYQDCPAFWSVPLSDEEIDYLLNNDIAEKTDDCKKLYPNFDNIQPAKQDALINMMFNMGLETMSTFVRTVAAVNAGDWIGVGVGLRKSLWFRQVGARAVRLISILEAR
jgi:lysozyme